MAALKLAEAITTSDIGAFASGMLIDREMLQNYQAATLQWTKFLTPTTVKSFKPKYMSELVLGSQVFKDVPERTAYPHAKGPRLSEYPIQVGKTGLLWGFSFEAQVNDDLDQLMMVPNAMPQIAFDTEDDRGLRVMINLETGALNTAFFNVGNNNIGTLVLNDTNLQTVITTLRTKRDPDTGAIIRPARSSSSSGPPSRTRPSGSSTRPSCWSTTATAATSASRTPQGQGRARRQREADRPVMDRHAEARHDDPRAVLVRPGWPASRPRTSATRRTRVAPSAAATSWSPAGRSTTTPPGTAAATSSALPRPTRP